MSFLDFYLSSNWERESGKRNLGIKENGPKVTYLIFFRRGSTGESFLLSRANRLCSIFLHWLEEPGVLRVSVILLSSTRSKMAIWFVRPLRTLLKNYLLTIYFRWGEGAPTSVLRSQPIIWLLSSSFLVSRFLRATRFHPSPVTGYKHLLVLIPTSVTHLSLKGHFFDG